jgi:hypothetical protein
MAKTPTIDQIRDAEASLDGLRQAYLRSRGWRYSCDYPDCCWRWSKIFDRGVVVTEGTTSDAVCTEEGFTA